MRFTKMHGCGNDFILLDAVSDPALADTRAWRDQVPAMCDRRRGIGADGVILVTLGNPHARAQIINADGSPGGMCGNGLRMVARLLIEAGHLPAAPLTVEMDARRVDIDPEFDDRGAVIAARADMGAPVLDPARVPVNTASLRRLDDDAWALGAHRCTFVSMGNPHAVLFVDRLPDADEIARLGPELEQHPAFPQRMNIQWAVVVEPGIVRAVTWERGAGATLACGTGACAIAVAGVLRGLTDRRVAVHMPGGALDVRWDDATNHVWLGGPVRRAFTGVWSPDAAL